MGDLAYSAKFNVEGLDKLGEVEKYVKLYKEKVRNKSTQFSYILEGLIKTNLSQVLGKKAKHFSIIVERSINGAVINIYSNDYIAVWTYYGTHAHWIDGGSPMPIAEGVFRYTVHHPGQIAMKPQIDGAIKQAIAEARRVVKFT
jgi:hypothetical protein